MWKRNAIVVTNRFPLCCTLWPRCLRTLFSFLRRRWLRMRWAWWPYTHPSWKGKRSHRGCTVYCLNCTMTNIVLLVYDFHNVLMYFQHIFVTSAGLYAFTLFVLHEIKVKQMTCFFVNITNRSDRKNNSW